MDYLLSSMYSLNTCHTEDGRSMLTFLIYICFLISLYQRKRNSLLSAESKSKSTENMAKLCVLLCLVDSVQEDRNISDLLFDQVEMTTLTHVAWHLQLDTNTNKMTGTAACFLI